MVDPAEEVLRVLRDRSSMPWLIAVAGIPGSGKSTLAAKIASNVPGAVVVPMDGYHLPRSALTADGLIRRGAPDTFDPESLRIDLRNLRESRQGAFPAFDHAVKDPQPGTIVVPEGTSLVIVEGIYLLMRDWALSGLFDFTIFLDCDVDVAMDRVAARHIDCGISSTPEEARHRADTNDRRNALAILSDGCRERAGLVVQASCKEPTAKPPDKKGLLRKSAEVQHRDTEEAQRFHRGNT